MATLMRSLAPQIREAAAAVAAPRKKRLDVELVMILPIFLIALILSSDGWALGWREDSLARNQRDTPCDPISESLRRPTREDLAWNFQSISKLALRS
jgi:hypothetical protein